MKLIKTKAEDLLFRNEIEDDRTNTYLTLNDYDWMSYNLKTMFRTEEMGVLEVSFEYFGFVFSMMKIKQTKNSKVQEYEFEYSTDIFQKYLVLFLQKHIETWSST